MPDLRPQQTDEEQQREREQERLLNARYFNKQKWRYRNVGAPWEDEDDSESLPSLSTAVTQSKLLKPGVYTREDPVSKYNFRLNADGSVVPLRGSLSPAREEWESVKSVANWVAYFAGTGMLMTLAPVFGLALPFVLDPSVYMNTVLQWHVKYSQTIDFLKIATGATTLHLDWPDSEYVTAGYIRIMMDLALSKNMVVEFGPNVEKYLDEHPALRKELVAKQTMQREKQALEFKKPEYLAVKRQLDYNTNKNAIAAEARLTGTDAEKKQQFEQVLAVNGQNETMALSKAVVDINQRLTHAEAATKEVAGHVASMTLADQAVYVQENGSDWQDLLRTVAAEQADLQTRVDLAQEKVTAQKAAIEAVAPTARTPEQTAQLTRLQQMEEKLQTLAARSEKLKNGDANTTGFTPLQQKVDGLIQTTAPRARR